MHLFTRVALTTAALLYGGALAIVSFFPRAPEEVGIVAFILILPMLFLAAPGFYGWLLSDRHFHAISKAEFSPLRIAFGVAGMVLPIVVAVAALMLLLRMT